MYLQPKVRNFKDLNNMAVSLFKLLSISSSSSDTFRKKSSEFINLFFIERNVSISESFLFLSEIPSKTNLLSNDISALLGNNPSVLEQFCKNKDNMIDLLNNSLFITISSSISPVFLTTDQTANFLSSNKQTIISFIKKNQLPAYKLGKNYRVHLPDIFAFMFSHKVKTTSKAKKSTNTSPNNYPNTTSNINKKPNFNSSPNFKSKESLDIKNKPFYNKQTPSVNQNTNKSDSINSHKINNPQSTPIIKPTIKDKNITDQSINISTPNTSLPNESINPLSPISPLNPSEIKQVKPILNDSSESILSNESIISSRVEKSDATLPYPTLQKENNIKNKENIIDVPIKIDTSTLPIIEVKNKIEQTSKPDSTDNHAKNTKSSTDEVLPEKILTSVEDKSKVHIPL